ncbi:hypothetical protein EYV94_16075 [Puteibacter caeruleilacunae]|nr:hypothetical protein EYV94_16075 [Puteibacter caeruleilacunae]
MKEFKLRQKQSVIRVLKEPPTAKKKRVWGWQRITFVLILLAIAFFILKRVYVGVFLVNGSGFVELSKQTVSFTEDIRIEDLFIQEGQTIAKGDTLFRYSLEQDGNSFEQQVIEVKAPIAWTEKEILDIKEKLAAIQVELLIGKKQAAILQSKVKKFEELVLMGADQFHNDLMLANKNLQLNELELEKLKLEEKVLKGKLYGISLLTKEIQQTEQAKVDAVMEQKYYVAPVAGIVGQIHLGRNEVCYEKQEMMTIHQENEIGIRVYFEPSDIGHLHGGELVNIRFPDGSKGKGIIDNLFVSTYELPVEFQKKYEPVKRNLVANVLPLSEVEAKRWMNFYKTEVKVTKSKIKISE